MKFVYCASCGKCLAVDLKAVPRLDTIVRIVEYHECGEFVDEFDLDKLDLSKLPETKGKNEFVAKINDLRQSKVDLDLRDRRTDENVKPQTSSAPISIKGMIDSISNSIPERALDESEE